MQASHHIVIVGGGAGGLELATRLGKKLAKITLVDEQSTHLWKPLLHEVAAGTLDAGQDVLNYFVHASLHHYHFQLGRMVGLNRQAKEIILAPVTNGHDEEIIPKRTLAYDTLVLAFGSVNNDFGIPGVREHCLFLDDQLQAEHFQQLFLKNLLRLQNRIDDQEAKKISIVIVGGGATGVELAAELHYTVLQAATFGLDRINPQHDIQITLIESSARILSALPERISRLAKLELQRRGIEVLAGERVNQVGAHSIQTLNNRVLPATIVVWCAGISIPVFADKLDGLELNRLNQIVVYDTLQTTVDQNIFAFGDCACCPQAHIQQPVPPRAQAANQQAQLLAQSLPAYLRGQTLIPFKYTDYGSLISLSKFHTLGNLMGKLMGNILIEGKIARLVYLSLYKKHQIILQGYGPVILQTLANFLTRGVRPRLKLH